MKNQNPPAWFLQLVALMGLVGCASTPNAPKKMETLAYTKGSSSELASNASGVCPKDLSKISGEKWKSVVATANACVKAAQWKSVEQIGNDLSKREPNSPWGMYYLALAAEAQGAPDRALWMLELALKKSPDAGILYYQKGRVLWSQSEFKSAMTEMQSAIRLDASLTEAHLFLGQVYYRDQDFDSAANHFYQVLSVRSVDSIALSGLAECRLHKGDSQGAMEILKRAVRAHPQELNFQVREAQVFESYLNLPSEALAIYQDIKKALERTKKPVQLAVDVNEKIRNLTAATRIPAAVAQPKAVVQKEKKQ